MKAWGTVLEREGFLKTKEHITAFNKVDRADFLTDEYKASSDKNEPLPIPFNKVQSAPHMDAIFVDKGKVNEKDIILEIGTGSGYFTLILSFLGKEVVSIELDPNLLNWASSNTSRYERDNIILIAGNVNNICLSRKFDLIISTASFKKEPAFLRNMLNRDGRIIYPFGEYPPQRLILFKDGKKEEIGWVSFVNVSD